MTDYIRKQLDALMGKNRNDEPGRKRHFTDSDVCKYYLCGLCPHDLFRNTKVTIGECKKLHSEPLKQEYEEARKMKDYGFEYKLEKYLEELVEDCDKKIEKAIKKLEESKSENGKDELKNQINLLFSQAEKLGEEGKVGESKELFQKAEQLKLKLQQEKQNSNSSFSPAAIISLELGISTTSAQTQQQKLRVCDVCSAYLSIFDSEKRLADHFGGKLHIAYLTIREKLKSLKERNHNKYERERCINRDKKRMSYLRNKELKEEEKNRENKRDKNSN